MKHNRLLTLLECPACRHSKWRLREYDVLCDECGSVFSKDGAIVDFLEAAPNRKESAYEGMMGKIYAAYMDTDCLQNLDSWLLSLNNRSYRNWFMSHSENIKGTFLDMPVGGAPFLTKSSCYRNNPWLGLDTSMTLLQLVQRKCQAAGITDFLLVRASADSLPIRTGAVDHVLSLFGFHCFHHKKAVLSEISRILRQGGGLQLSTLSMGYSFLADWYIRFLEGDGTFAPGVSASVYTEMVCQLFQQVETSRIGAAWLCSGRMA